MAYTETGGDLLKIEAVVMDGTGKLELTGSLGDVMKESAKLAISYIRAHAKSLELTRIFIKIKTSIYTFPKVPFRRTARPPVLQFYAQ